MSRFAVGPRLPMTRLTRRVLSEGWWFPAAHFFTCHHKSICCTASTHPMSQNQVGRRACRGTLATLNLAGRLSQLRIVLNSTVPTESICCRVGVNARLRYIRRRPTAPDALVCRGARGGWRSSVSQPPVPVVAPRELADARPQAAPEAPPPFKLHSSDRHTGKANQDKIESTKQRSTDQTNPCMGCAAYFRM